LFGQKDNSCGYDTPLTLYYLINDLVHLPNPTSGVQGTKNIGLYT